MCCDKHQRFTHLLVIHTQPYGIFTQHKYSVYIGPHTWEPCVPSSLTHRLDPCHHLVITERLELCGRNCLISKEASRGRIRDLDRVFLCPLCPKFNRQLTNISKDVKAGDVPNEAKDSSNSDSKLLKKTAITQSISNLHPGSFHEHGDMRTNEIQCKSVV
jgi:hypothetical protein